MVRPASDRIRALNDQFRAQASSFDQLYVTAGVNAKGPEFVSATIQAATGFDNFTPENDPNGEHDFGSFELAGETVFWKIDYYDQSLQLGSEDPANPSITIRVLTIMLASEY